MATKEDRGNRAQIKAQTQMELPRSVSRYRGSISFSFLEASCTTANDTSSEPRHTNYLILAFFLFVPPFIQSRCAQGTLLFADQAQQGLGLAAGLTGVCRLRGRREREVRGQTKREGRQTHRDTSQRQGSCRILRRCSGLRCCPCSAGPRPAGR